MEAINKTRDEEITYTTRPHWIVMAIRGAVASGVALLGAGLAKDAFNSSQGLTRYPVWSHG